jgi:hypothetical protein
MDLGALRELVECEIDSYIYAVPAGALGLPMSDEWVCSQLAEMRAALVEPRWTTILIRDTVEQMRGEADAELRQCVLVADDRSGYQLYYDPVPEDFVLAYSGEPPITFNVRGDAVGCFMSRCEQAGG